MAWALTHRLDVVDRLYPKFNNDKHKKHLNIILLQYFLVNSNQCMSVIVQEMLNIL